MKTVFEKTFLIIALCCFSIVGKSSNRYIVRHKRLKDGTSIIMLSDEKDGIEACVVPSKGGELSSLRIFFHNQWHELLYRALDYGNIKGWRGKAPLLWPAVGRNYASNTDEKNNKLSYLYHNQYYEIPIHGFARFCTWHVVRMYANHKKSEVILSMDDSQASQDMYPFRFKVYVVYSITNGHYEAAYRIIANKSNKGNMFFSIGNHITFNVPLIKNSQLDHCYFETPLTVQYVQDDKGIPTGKTLQCNFMPKVPITDFKAHKSVSLGGSIKKNPWVKLYDPSGLSITLYQHAQSLPELPFVRFNIWGDTAAGYLSMEPWVGLQNSFNLHKGLIYLRPGQAWKWNLRIDINRIWHHR